MGRKLYRVPLDFNWPRDKVWEGYLNPNWDQSTKCTACGGSALNPASRLISETFYAHDPHVIKAILDKDIEPAPENFGLISAMRAKPQDWLPWHDKITQDEVEELVKHHRLHDWTLTFGAVKGEGWKPKDPPYMPTAAEVNAVNAPGARNFLRSHDGINRCILIEFRAKKYNVWGRCPHCDEEGRIWPEGVKEKYDAWTKEEPPTGEGYQLWENTSEGSPQSPVFATMEELCEWCAENASVFAGEKATARRWREMLDADFVAHAEETTEGTMLFM
jgi:hypothetical protein